MADDDKAAKKKRLDELIGKKRKEKEEAAEAERQKRMKFRQEDEIDFGDDSEDEEPGGIPPTQEIAAARTGTSEGGFNEEEDNDVVPNEADLDFIDDDGVALEDQVDFGDDADIDAAGLAYDEAEEAAEDLGDELDRMFAKGRKREGENEAENRIIVESLLTQMELAAENDLIAFEQRKPAVYKLRMLGRVQEVLSMKKLHNELLDYGVLGALKTWLEPMPDGTLPNSKVRGTVLSLLQRLPVDCSYEDRREQLKRSQLGRIVMFLSKVPDETPDNRRIAKDLVERWSRPILAPRGAPAVDEEESQRILAARQAKQRALKEKADAEVAAGAGGADGEARALRPGDPGFRFHAAIPQAASLDYVRRPESKAVMMESRGGKSSEHKITKKLQTMGKRTNSRAANVSVEGRNVTFMDK